MAITPTAIGYVDGLKHMTAQVVSVACDNSYPTGGYAFDPASLYGFVNLAFVGIDGENGYNAQYDYTNKKIKFYTSAGTETTNATNLSAVTLRIVVIGY